MILPRKVVLEIESICRSFLWNGNHVSTGSAAVAWNSICDTKSTSGLGFRNISDWNLAAMFKYVWAIAKKEDNLWVKWVHNVYIKEDNWWSYKATSAASWYWKKLVTIKERARELFDEDQVLNEKYKVVVGFQSLRPSTCRVEWSSIVWSRMNMPKHSFIFWLSMLNRLKTKDRIQVYKQVEDTKCFFCQTEEETLQHLFFDCSFSSNCLKEIKDWLSWRMASNSLHRIVRWIRKAKISKAKKDDSYCSFGSPSILHLES
ncbi:hypothetical protein CsatB_008503 [Cannabis sativa]